MPLAHSLASLLPRIEDRLASLAALPTVRSGVAISVCVAVLVGLGLYIRWPATQVTRFRNEDVAGITYNADLLRQGGTPYGDNLEIKSPGTFFLTWGAWAIWGRSLRVLERVGVAWAILAGLGVFVVGLLLFGTASGFLAALIYTVYSPISDSMTVNYHSWMVTTYIWSTVFFIAGLRQGKGWQFAVCGVLVSVSALLKHQGAFLLPLYAGILLAGPHLSLPLGWRAPRRWPAMLALVAGTAAGFVPIGLFYLYQGHFWALISNFFFSDSGWRYVAGELGWQEKLARVEDGFTGLWEFLLMPTVLATLTVAAVPLDRRRGADLVLAFLVGDFLLSLLAVAIGFRFFKGYYIQVLPALAWMAAHPDGPLLRWFRGGLSSLPPRQLAHRAAGVLVVAAVILATGQSAVQAAANERRERHNYGNFQLEAERIAGYVREHTKPSERIWVWGRWAWPVYYFSERMSVTRFYKVLGVVTNNLTNTWKRPTAMTRFMPVGPYLELGQDLTRGKPAYLVTSNNEDYSGFTALEQLLKKEYVEVPMPDLTAFHVYRRKDHK